MKKPLQTYLTLSTFIFIFAFFIYFLVQHTSAKSNSKINSNIVTIAFESAIKTFDPRIIGFDPNSQYLEELRFAPLISFDENGNLIYKLAESISPISNRSWQIKLKQGIQFHNGHIVTADDVVATYHAIMNPEFGFPVSPRKGAFKNVISFEKKSQNEIYLELNEPDASFLNNLIIGILPAQEALKAPPNEVNNKGDESGPFILKSASDTKIVLLKNEKYNLSSMAKIQQVEFKIIPDSGTRYAALVKGDIDIIQNSLDPDKIEGIEKNMKDMFHVFQHSKLAITYLGMNFKVPALQNSLVRQAIACALPVSDIIKYRLHSDEAPANSLFPPENSFYNSMLPQKCFDIQKAKEHLIQSGIKLPYALSIKVSSSDKWVADMAKSMASKLNSIGFNTKIETLEFSLFQEQIRKGNSQLWLGSWIGFKDPDHLRFVFASNMVPPYGGNRGFYSNSSLDKLLEEGKATLNFDERKKIYDKAQEIISKELPYIFLFHGKIFSVVSNKISGFTPYADGRYSSLVNIIKN